MPSRAGSPDPLEPVNMHTISEKYNITPSAGLLLFPNDKEEDDDLHDPTTGVNDRECDIFTKRGLVNVGGLALISVGILVLFIGYPILYVVSLPLLGTITECRQNICAKVYRTKNRRCVRRWTVSERAFKSPFKKRTDRSYR